MKRLPRFAVEHPVIVITGLLGLLFGGYLAYKATPIELQPYVESPTVGIIITYPGVSSEDMETYFTRPIEQKMTVLDDVQFIRSHSQEGRSEVAIGFSYGADMNKNKVSVQTLLSNMLNELPIDPANTTNPWVVHVDSQNVPILDLNIRREGWDPVRLREFVENTIRDQVEAIPGVQSAIPYGGERRVVEITVDRDRLAGYRLSLLDIRRAIDRSNLSRSGGRLVQPDEDYLIRVDERYRTAAEMTSLPVGTFEDRVVYLEDVAEVRDTHAEVRSSYHFSEKEGERSIRDTDGVLLAIVKQPEVGDPPVIEKTFELMDGFVREYPGLQYDVAYNRLDFIEVIIQNSWNELFLAFGLASLVLLIFLEELSATLVVLVIMPISVLASFIFYTPFGLTINTPTMMGLVFVIGRLVDDSVVMLEVISRHHKMGKSSKQAAIDGAEELIFATLATSFTFWVVLSPNLTLGGSMGIGFYGMTLPMILANVFSTLLALTLTPMMAAYLFHPVSTRPNPLRRALKAALTPFRVVIDRTVDFYSATLRVALAHRLLVVAFAVGFIWVGVKVYTALGWEGMPLQDTGQAVGEVEAWPGTGFAESERIASQVEEILLKQPEVKLISTQIGQEPVFGTYFSGYGVRTVNKAFFKVTLTHKGDRVYQFYERWLEKLGFQFDKTGRDIWQILDSVQAEVVENVPGVRSIWLMEMGATPVNSARAPVEAIIKGDDYLPLGPMGNEMLKVAERSPGVYQPFTSWSLSLPQYHLDIDRRRAGELGLDVQSVAMQAFYALQGGMTEQFFKPEEGYRHNRYLIRYREDQRLTPEDLGNMMLSTPKGVEVPLKEVATIERRVGTDLIYKEDLKYAVSVLAQYRDLGLKNATRNLIAGSKMSIDLPKGYTVTPTGLMMDMMDNIDRLQDGLTYALFFLFVLLLFQSGSFVATTAILTDIPFQVTGALWFLYIRQFYWSPPALWGQTIAVAIVTGTGIYLVDKIRQLEKEGRSVTEAILEAGPIRLRPVMMTAITTAVAFIPPMFAPPTGMDRFRPITTGIIGAMVSSTLVSLIAVPVYYSLLRDLQDFLRWLFSSKAYEVAPPFLRSPETESVEIRDLEQPPGANG